MAELGVKGASFPSRRYPESRGSTMSAILATGLVVVAAFPVRISTGFGYSISVFDVTLLALLYVFVMRRLAGVPLRVGPPAVAAAAAIPALAGFTSLLWTDDFAVGARAVVSALSAVLAYLVVLDLTGGLSPRAVARLAALFSVLLVLAGLATWMRVPGFEPPASASDPWSWYARLSHPFIGKSNNLATLLVLLIPILLWSAARYRSLWFWMAALVGIAGTILTFSRGALLVLITILVIYATRSARDRKLGTLRTVGIGVLAMIVVAVLANSFSDQLVGVEQRLRLEDQGRVLLLQRAMMDIGSSPILGTGSAPEFDAHNTYVQFLVEYGVILGFICCVALLLAVFVWFVRRPDNGSPTTRFVVGLSFLAGGLMFAVQSSYSGALPARSSGCAGGLRRPTTWLNTDPPPRVRVSLESAFGGVAPGADLHVSIVTYRSLEYLLGCLDALLTHLPHASVGIVDNSAEVDRVREVVTMTEQRHPHACIAVSQNCQNVGYARGVNLAFGLNPGRRYFLVLNPDVQISDNLAGLMDGTQTYSVVAGLLNACARTGTRVVNARRRTSYAGEICRAMLGGRAVRGYTSIEGQWIEVDQLDGRSC